MNEITIYKITNPEGKVYIGQTNNLDRRLSQYKYAKCHSQPKLRDSLNKYGFDKHIVVIADTCSVEDAFITERLYIDKYDCINSGLNSITTGRKEKPEQDKIKQKKVYISDKEEKQILKATKTKDLTAALRTTNNNI